jgi:hypothetical protein
MTILYPQTASIQGFQVRTRPTASSSTIGASNLDLYFVNEDTNQEAHFTPVSASYDTYGFLVVSASMYVTASDFYTLRINQLYSGSVCQELYRGLVFATTESAQIHNSDPLSSYTGSTTAQKLNEFIIWNP